MMNQRLPRTLLMILAMGMALSSTGCVRRMLHVSSTPAGAQLYVNEVYRGRTPVQVTYNWNWYYDLRLEAPGHETLEIREKLSAPPRHWLGLDLVAELMPWGSREDTIREYKLRPLQQP